MDKCVTINPGEQFSEEVQKELKDSLDLINARIEYLTVLQASVRGAERVELDRLHLEIGKYHMVPEWLLNVCVWTRKAIDFLTPDMKPIEFPQQNIVFAKDQPQYQPLPAYAAYDEHGTVVCCWELTDEEIEKLKETKKLYISFLTFNQPLNPLYPTVHPEDVLPIIPHTNGEQPTTNDTAEPGGE